MRKTSLLTYLLTLIFLVTGQAMLVASCPCGCHCEHECTCSCLEGHECHCGMEAKNPGAGVYEEAAGGCCCGDHCNCLQEEGEGCCCGEHCHCPQYDNNFLWHNRYLRYPPIACDGCMWGEWLCEKPVLMRPFLADPRKVTYSAGWRFNDQVLEKNVIDVSYADTCQLYRWYNVWPWCGQLQFEVEGALWAVFDPTHESSPLMNADYYVGFPLTYAIDNWSFRLRGYHISSHIGDEFLLNHPHFNRKNPSVECLDFFISHEYTDLIRIYGGLGYILVQDDSFWVKPFYAAYGAELRLPLWRFYRCDQHLYGEPFFAMHFRYQPDFVRHVDQTYVLGYEFAKTVGLRRALRFYMEYHDGYSTEGQFSLYPTNYFAVRLTYGF